MIVDIHTHPPRHRELPPGAEPELNHKWRPDRPVNVTTTWKDFFAGQTPAEVSVVFGIAMSPGGPAYPADPDWSEGNINDAVAEFAAAHPGRLIGFAAVHPFDPDCLDELERCRVDLGMQGVKLAANYQNYEPLEPRPWPSTTTPSATASPSCFTRARRRCNTPPSATPIP